MSEIAAVTAVLQDSPYLVSFSDDLGHSWTADEPTDLGGGNRAPSPDRLMLSSLGACTVITLQMVAVRRQLPLTGVRVEVQLNPDGKPAAGTDIRRSIYLTGDLTDEQRAQLLKVANACPMHKLLTGEVRIDTELV